MHRLERLRRLTPTAQRFFPLVGLLVCMHALAPSNPPSNARTRESNPAARTPLAPDLPLLTTTSLPQQLLPLPHHPQPRSVSSRRRRRRHPHRRCACSVFRSTAARSAAPSCHIQARPACPLHPIDVRSSSGVQRSEHTSRYVPSSRSPPSS
ncbi:hypothetical protein L1887_58194 [Cichorium endivia]|nr:hypothetical protein L1887_58194 [Cichorium endivia]